MKVASGSGRLETADSAKPVELPYGPAAIRQRDDCRFYYYTVWLTITEGLFLCQVVNVFLPLQIPAMFRIARTTRLYGQVCRLTPAAWCTRLFSIW